MSFQLWNYWKYCHPQYCQMDKYCNIDTCCDCPILLNKCEENTMVFVSIVQPSINLEFLCTYKNLKMSLYTLSNKYCIWKVMHKTIVVDKENSCRPIEPPWYFLRVESPLCCPAYLKYILIMWPKTYMYINQALPTLICKYRCQCKSYYLSKLESVTIWKCLMKSNGFFK